MAHVNPRNNCWVPKPSGQALPPCRNVVWAGLGEACTFEKAENLGLRCMLALQQPVVLKGLGLRVGDLGFIGLCLRAM